MKYSISEKYIKWEESLNEGKISKHEAANALREWAAIIEAKLANLGVLKKSLELMSNDFEREQVLKIMTNESSQIEFLENLIAPAFKKWLASWDGVEPNILDLFSRTFPDTVCETGKEERSTK